MVMQFPVSQLHVVVYQVEIGKNPPLEDGQIEAATCLQSHMNLLVLESAEERFEVVRKQGAFTARQRNTALGVPVERQITKQDLQQAFHRIVLPNAAQGPPGTNSRTAPAACTPDSVDPTRIFESDGSLRTHRHTLAATQALPAEEADLDARVLGLGTMAEDAPERTSFEEDHGADAGPVLQAAAFDLD
jgi:hypothetical protein